ncbi:hypothetical protein NEMIN01_1192 [Nematocida minor]|uniref:uncharacterized protein n=1 Tax=Nematocida minor TaxID=1912983 RepID=UPI00221F5040|nr:uncharacterized protein NEMIN01_1192 [Nematocida minor]KAI5190727.1 hypothetical protein NEMIN01_1192 [Nematocida minor]
MEIAFHSNKCALKDSLRLIKIGKSPCWKRKSKLLSYSEGLISSNKNIISLHAGISEHEKNEFTKLEEQFINLSNTTVSSKGECAVCRRDCLEDLSNEQRIEDTADERIVAYYDREQESRTSKIEEVTGRMERLNTKAEYIESIINMHKEELDKLAYNNTSSLEYSESHLLELDGIMRRKRRALFIKKWLSGLLVFFCFVSLLLLKPFIP